MALFDFLKRKDKHEEARSRRERASDHKHEHNEENKEDKHEHKGDEKPERRIVEERYHEGLVLEAPHITEKSRDLSLGRGYVFRVKGNATKKDVEHSVEQLYHVHVERVRMVTLPGKPRRRGLTQGRKKGYKKAIVSLRDGESIDLI